MKNLSLKSVLARLGIPENQWVRLKDVYQLILSGDANIFAFDSPGALSEDNKYFFDTNNELLFIKKYSSKKLISSRFDPRKCSFFNNRIEFHYDSFFGGATYPGLVYTGKKIPVPEVGDYVFTVDKRTLKQINSSVVSEVKSVNQIVTVSLENPIDMQDVIVCWAKGLYFDQGEVGEEDESLLWFSRPITERNFDSAITFDILSGISLNRIFVKGE